VRHRATSVAAGSSASRRRNGRPGSVDAVAQARSGIDDFVFSRLGWTVCSPADHYCRPRASASLREPLLANDLGAVARRHSADVVCRPGPSGGRRKARVGTVKPAAGTTKTHCHWPTIVSKRDSCRLQVTGQDLTTTPPGQSHSRDTRRDSTLRRWAGLDRGILGARQQRQTLPGSVAFQRYSNSPPGVGRRSRRPCRRPRGDRDRWRHRCGLISRLTPAHGKVPAIRTGPWGTTA